MILSHFQTRNYQLSNQETDIPINLPPPFIACSSSVESYSRLLFSADPILHHISCPRPCTHKAPSTNHIARKPLVLPLKSELTQETTGPKTRLTSSFLRYQHFNLQVLRFKQAILVLGPDLLAPRIEWVPHTCTQEHLFTSHAGKPERRIAMVFSQVEFSKSLEIMPPSGP